MLKLYITFPIKVKVVRMVYLAFECTVHTLFGFNFKSGWMWCDPEQNCKFTHSYYTNTQYEHLSNTSLYIFKIEKSNNRNTII